MPVSAMEHFGFVVGANGIVRVEHDNLAGNAYGCMRT
ncbi:hypothetical protein HNQ08_001562 [Deinococcus humi]|uniref:Uncharacterized protein n=1 Tax=Deinococcus humi TaxID=662880 RepID=A0A7W8JSL5_9DEIO|nr:hypothetical protein [Deinococcus humi]